MIEREISRERNENRKYEESGNDGGDATEERDKKKRHVLKRHEHGLCHRKYVASRLKSLVQ